MKLMPQGDYYLWYCEWCDSRNLTLWTRVAENHLCCAACHKNFSAFDDVVLTGGGDEAGVGQHTIS